MSRNYNLCAPFLRPPSPPQVPAAPQNRHLARTQEGSRHHDRPHRLSQAQTFGLPLQLYPSWPLLCPPRNRPLRRPGPVVSRCRVVFSPRHTGCHTRGLSPSVPARCFADELADTLHAEVQDPLHAWCARDVCAVLSWPDASCTRPPIVGRPGSAPPRQTVQSVPLLADASALQILPKNSRPPFAFLQPARRAAASPVRWSGVHEAGHGGDSIWPNSSA